MNKQGSFLFAVLESHLQNSIDDAIEKIYGEELAWSWPAGHLDVGKYIPLSIFGISDKVLFRLSADGTFTIKVVKTYQF